MSMDGPITFELYRRRRGASAVEDSVYAFEVAQMMNQQIPNSQTALIPGVADAAILEGADRANDAILS